MRKPFFVDCPDCDGTKLPHRMCTICGYYKGRKVISVEAEIE
jgi:large subunit ribosomal protein L32